MKDKVCDSRQCHFDQRTYQHGMRARTNVRARALAIMFVCISGGVIKICACSAVLLSLSFEISVWSQLRRALFVLFVGLDGID